MMGIYYHLLNDTKRERVHLDHNMKRGPMTQNPAIHFALCNYMMENLGDVLRMCDDMSDNGKDYIDINLLSYKFDKLEVTTGIVKLLEAVDHELSS
jgi:hypothetical protein